MQKPPRLTYAMHTAEKSTHPFAILLVLQLRPTATAPLKQCITKPLKLQQGLPAVSARCHDGNFRSGKLQSKAVLLENRRIGPALRTIELDHQRLRILAPDLIHPIFVTAERQHPP